MKSPVQMMRYPQENQSEQNHHCWFPSHIPGRKFKFNLHFSNFAKGLALFYLALIPQGIMSIWDRIERVKGK
jgi:hypothetical protein